MTSTPLRTTFEGAVAHVTLDRPERLNALNAALIDALHRCFLDLAERPDIRVVVLRGAGRAFCAGADLNEGVGPRPLNIVHGLEVQRRVRNVMLAMRRCPQPIVSLVQGAASGGGFALALASDIRLATPDARMNAAFIRIGLSGCDVGVSYFLPRMVGSSVAAELMLTGRFLDAPRALSLGLVSAVAPLPELEGHAGALVEDMLRTSPLGLRLTKDAMSHNVDAAGLEAAIALEDRNQILCAASEDFKEGAQAFLEKREPHYRNR